MFMKYVAFCDNLINNSILHSVSVDTIRVDRVKCKGSSAPLSKNAVSAFQIACKLLSFALFLQTINALQYLKAVSTVSNICTYNLLPWEWIEQKFEV